MVSTSNYRLDKQGGFIFRHNNDDKLLPGLRVSAGDARSTVKGDDRQRRAKDRTHDPASILPGL